jgi:hypothetical protein
MYSLSPIPLLLSQSREQRELTPAIIDLAHATAVRVLRDAGDATRAAFENQMASLLIGGVTPLIANMVFGWPAYLVILGIAADNTMLWLADFLKAFFAPDEFERQWKQQCDAADAVAIAGVAAAHTREVDARGMPVFSPVRRQRDPSAYARITVLIAILPLCWGSLFYPTEADEHARIITFIVLSIPVAARMLLAAIAVRLSGESPSQSLSLLPQASRPLFAFLCAALLFTLGRLFFDIDHTRPARYEGVAFFSIYLLCSAAAAFSALSRMRESERLLQKFVAMDLAPLKQRVAGAPSSGTEIKSTLTVRKTAPAE